MFDVFVFSFNAVAPILLLVLLGLILKKAHFAGEDFFKKANSLVFKVFLPIMLFCNVYEIESLGSVNWRAAVYSVFAVLLFCALGFLCCRLFVKKKEQKGVIIQCSFRSNHAIIGIPLAQSLGGAEALSFACLLSAVAIPLFNVLAVLCLSHYSTGEERPHFSDTVKKTVKNPLIIGVACGAAALLVRSLLPKGADGSAVFTIKNNLPFLWNALSSAAKIASPLALVVLGARFDFAAVRALRRQISLGVILRNFVAPALGIGLALLLSKRFSLFPVTANELPAFISVFGSPAAVSSAVMVSEIGGDDQLATQLVVWTSIVSLFSVFLTVFVLKSAALL